MAAVAWLVLVVSTTETDGADVSGAPKTGAVHAIRTAGAIDVGLSGFEDATRPVRMARCRRLNAVTARVVLRGVRLAYRGSRSRREAIRTDQAVVIADAMGPFCGIGCDHVRAGGDRPVHVRQHPGRLGVIHAGRADLGRALAIGFLLLAQRPRGRAAARTRCRSGSRSAALVGLNPLVYILGTQITYPAIGMLLVIVGGRRAVARLVLGRPS